MLRTGMFGATFIKLRNWSFDEANITAMNTSESSWREGCLPGEQLTTQSATPDRIGRSSIHVVSQETERPLDGPNDRRCDARVRKLGNTCQLPSS